MNDMIARTPETILEEWLRIVDPATGPARTDSFTMGRPMIEAFTKEIREALTLLREREDGHAKLVTYCENVEGQATALRDRVELVCEEIAAAHVMFPSWEAAGHEYDAAALVAEWLSILRGERE